ncbi:MAG: hypothetical protein IPK99_10200 [Flavobacteriales bacterium]|nr:hypothetical protein [Flavobacteriales bacterium]
MKSIPSYCLAIALTALPALLLAQSPGAFDPTFNPTDLGFHMGYGAGGHVDAAVRQPDGKVIIGGYFDTYNSTPTRSLARLTPDGLIDTTFQTSAGLAYGTVNSMALQADGRVLVGGNFLVFDGDTVNNLMRLMPDGTRDTTFDVGSGFDDLVRSLALQADGKIIAAGDFDTLNGAPHSGIARLLADGTVDPTFTTGTGFQPASSQKVNHVFVQPDGKIFCSGGFYTYNGITSGCFARLNSDGTLDGTFVPQTIAGVPYYTVMQSNGRYVTGGWFVQYGGVSVGRIMRLQSNGALDASYITGTGFNSDVHRLVIQPDGKVIVGGSFTTYDGLEYLDLVRLQTNGVADPTFSQGGLGGHYYTPGDARVGELLLEPLGGFYTVGQFIHAGGRTANSVAHLFTDGTPDPLYNPGYGVLGFLHDVAVQPDGKVLGVGRVHGYNGLEEHGSIADLELQPDGKILVGGGFQEYNGISCGNIVRLLTNGAVDTTFQYAVAFNEQVSGIALQSDGRIVCVGGFTDHSGNPVHYIARLNADGSFDASYATGTHPGVLRMNADGSPDTLFNANVDQPNGSVKALALQPDGDIIVGGIFSAWGGVGRNKIARIHGGDLATGLSVPSPAPSFRVQPNPVADGQLRLVGLPSGARLLRVFDTQGRLVLNEALHGSPEWSGALPVTVGAYAVVITGDGAAETRRVLVP